MIHKVNPIVQWWMTPMLPYQDIYELPLLKNKGFIPKYLHLFSQWVIHPIKRRLARVYLRFLRKFFDIKVIGVTGSAGKSSTVQLLESILSLQGSTIATPHSIDPVYNIPNTILRCTPATKYLILEMSVEYPGEMDYYLWLGIPDIGLILNIFPTHLASLGSVQGVLAEKIKLVKRLEKNKIAILNSSDLLLRRSGKSLKCKVGWFIGINDPMQNNSNAASKAAELLGIDKSKITKAISRFKNPDHRLQLIKLPYNIQILDDTYNSNPKAAIAALDYFNKIAKGEKIAILGDMLDLGDYQIKAHKELGKKVSEFDFNIVVGIGKSIKITLDEVKNRSKSKVLFADSVDEAVDIVRSYMVKDLSIFVKGSRSLELDKLVAELSTTK